MGQRMSRREFYWSYTEEPHSTRRKLILKRNPEVKSLFGLDHSFKWVVSAMVVTQIIACYLLKDSDWLLIVLQAYFYGGVVNHGLTLAVHETAHNFAFGHKRPLANRIFGMWSNLPIGVPMSVSFKKYHLEHHRYLGEDVLDTDIPSKLETLLFKTTVTKLIWLILQPFFYGLRPLLTYKKLLSFQQVTDLEIVNFVVQIVFDVLIYKFLGFKGTIHTLCLKII